MAKQREPGLAEYRRKRDARRTPEPIPDADVLPHGDDDTFVIQEHHATALHWDLRLEHEGVLASWAVPKGLPMDLKTNHLAVHTEDHPLEYADFSGTIPKGEYGGGRMTIWDRGTYELEKWSDREVMVVLHGRRVDGRYVLFRTDGKNWMIHRMDAPARADWTAMPELVAPMLATPSQLPASDTGWSFETKWDGVRAVAYVEGGRMRLMSRNDLDVTVSYPELRGLGPALGSTAAVLDGEIVAFAADGRPSFGRLQRRMHVGNAKVAGDLAKTDPVTYVVFDVLYLDGRSTVELPYRERRDLLAGLGLDGRRWLAPPALSGPGRQILAASAELGLEGIVAKRLDSRYLPGRRSADWLKIKNVRMQEVVIGGWKPGGGRREGTVGSLLLGIPGEDGELRYAGGVGTGLTQAMLGSLHATFRRLERTTSPFADIPKADAKDAHWVTPSLVGEVQFAEWSGDGRLRHPSWRGLRPDKEPGDVVREE